MKTLFIALRTLVYMTSFVLLFGWLVQNVRPLDQVLDVTLPSWSEVAGIIVMLPGGILLLTCAGLFVVRGQGTLAVFDPPREFVALGPYQYVRNPMYIGGLTLLFGLGLYLRSGSILLFAVGMFLLLHAFVRYVEEPGLERRFGHNYLAYKRSVNRWIPNLF